MSGPLRAAGLPAAEQDLDRRRQRVRDHADERAAAALIRALQFPPADAARLEATMLLVAREVLDDVLPYALARPELLGPVTPLARRHDRAMAAVVRERVRVARLRGEVEQLRRELDGRP